MKKRILFVCNTTGARLWRILPIAKYMAKNGFEVFIRDVREAKLSDSDYADLIVFQCIFDSKAIRQIQKKGKKIIYEFDDLMHWVPKDHYAREQINFRRTLEIIKTIRIADGITTTNEYLKKIYNKYRLFKKPIFIFPNYMDFDYWEKEENPNRSKIVRIGWAGGSSHVNDLKLLVNPLKKVLNKYQFVKFIHVGAGGFSGKMKLTEYNYHKDLFKELPQEKREFSLGTKMEIWADKLNTLQLDIGLASVCKNSFSLSKTPIKYMEYAINKVPCIASKTLYDQIVNHGYDGFLAKTEEDWYKYLCLLIENPGLRKTIGKRAYAKVKQDYDFEKHAWKLVEFYKQFLK